MVYDPRSPTPPLSPRPFLRWLWQLTKDVVDEYRNDGVGDLAASITFWTILSVPAAVLALVSALSSLGSVVGTSLAADVQAEAEQFIADTLVESDTLTQAVGELFTTSSAGVATVATIVALFTLSRAFAGLIRALDIAYEVDEGRPWWYLRIVAIGLGVATIMVVAAAATVLALLPALPLSNLLRFLTAPAVFVGLVLWAAALFHIGPNHKTPWRYELPGAVITAVGWVAASQGFAVYVRISGGGNQVQSSVGAILLALSLMYLLSLVMLVGAELNDVIARRADVVSEVTSVQARARSWRDTLARLRPGAETADTNDDP
jgi:membrane protein